MGIKLLTSLLNTSTCKNSIKKIDLFELSGKVVVVDTYIYMYKYLKEGRLLENIYLMCFIFRKYNITPLFIFDGNNINKKKTEELHKRREMKKNAFKEYNNLRMFSLNKCDYKIFENI